MELRILDVDNSTPDICFEVTASVCGKLLYYVCKFGETNAPQSKLFLYGCEGGFNPCLFSLLYYVEQRCNALIE